MGRSGAAELVGSEEKRTDIRENVANDRRERRDDKGRQKELAPWQSEASRDRDRRRRDRQVRLSPKSGQQPATGDSHDAPGIVLAADGERQEPEGADGDSHAGEDVRAEEVFRSASEICSDQQREIQKSESGNDALQPP
jgi:hypothetical protein